MDLDIQGDSKKVKHSGEGVPPMTNVAGLSEQPCESQ
jgi:hypothetical protein